MFTQRQKHLANALLSAVAALLLLTTSAQSAMISNNLQTTETPALLNSSVTTQLNNSSMEEPRVLLSQQKPCRSEHENYCANGGTCMYPQDNDKPFCICTSMYAGERCLFIVAPTSHGPQIEFLIAFWFGVAMLFIFLVMIFSCCAYKIFKKSAKLIKSAPSQSV
ncbi:epigen [Sebastes umbrosus]|uniref:epigen n=1 Tax=Sebastes umbrosus TaxID=72105 RepID=UPI00189C5D5D|nr:epigen [Sebastes umbrosus]